MSIAASTTTATAAAAPTTTTGSSRDNGNGSSNASAVVAAAAAAAVYLAQQQHQQMNSSNGTPMMMPPSSSSASSLQQLQMMPTTSSAAVATKAMVSASTRGMYHLRRHLDRIQIKPEEREMFRLKYIQAHNLNSENCTSQSLQDCLPTLIKQSTLVLLEKRTSVGRNPEMVDVVLHSESESQMISRSHAEIVAHTDEKDPTHVLRYSISDRSMNGTYVNGERVPKEPGTFFLKQGDVVRFGILNGTILKQQDMKPVDLESAEFTFTFEPCYSGMTYLGHHPDGTRIERVGPRAFMHINADGLMPQAYDRFSLVPRGDPMLSAVPWTAAAANNHHALQQQSIPSMTAAAAAAAAAASTMSTLTNSLLYPQLALQNNALTNYASSLVLQQQQQQQQQQSMLADMAAAVAAAAPSTPAAGGSSRPSTGRSNMQSAGSYANQLSAAVWQQAMNTSVNAYDTKALELQLQLGLGGGLGNNAASSPLPYQQAVLLYYLNQLQQPQLNNALAAAASTSASATTTANNNVWSNLFGAAATPGGQYPSAASTPSNQATQQVLSAIQCEAVSRLLSGTPGAQSNAGCVASSTPTPTYAPLAGQTSGSSGSGGSGSTGPALGPGPTANTAAHAFSSAIPTTSSSSSNGQMSTGRPVDSSPDEHSSSTTASSTVGNDLSGFEAEEAPSDPGRRTMDPSLGLLRPASGFAASFPSETSPVTKLEATDGLLQAIQRAAAAASAQQPSSSKVKTFKDYSDALVDVHIEDTITSVIRGSGQLSAEQILSIADDEDLANVNVASPASEVGTGEPAVKQPQKQRRPYGSVKAATTKAKKDAAAAAAAAAKPVPAPVTVATPTATFEHTALQSTSSAPVTTPRVPEPVSTTNQRRTSVTFRTPLSTSSQATTPTTTPSADSLKNNIEAILAAAHAQQQQQKKEKKISPPPRPQTPKEQIKPEQAESPPADPTPSVEALQPLPPPPPPAISPPARISEVSRFSSTATKQESGRIKRSRSTIDDSDIDQPLSKASQDERQHKEKSVTSSSGCEGSSSTIGAYTRHRKKSTSVKSRIIRVPRSPIPYKKGPERLPGHKSNEVARLLYDLEGSYMHVARKTTLGPVRERKTTANDEKGSKDGGASDENFSDDEDDHRPSSSATNGSKRRGTPIVHESVVPSKKRSKDGDRHNNHRSDSDSDDSSSESEDENAIRERKRIEAIKEKFALAAPVVAEKESSVEPGMMKKNKFRRGKSSALNGRDKHDKSSAIKHRKKPGRKAKNAANGSSVGSGRRHHHHNNKESSKRHTSTATLQDDDDDPYIELTSNEWEKCASKSCSEPRVETTLNWIQCDLCDSWFHVLCVFGRADYTHVGDFHCVPCQEKKFVSTPDFAATKAAANKQISPVS